MTLRIRQIVVVAQDLETTVSQFAQVLGVRECYRDPNVAEFGLENALMAIGDQFLEVVSPTQANTAAGRHLQRHGDSAYMLILQTDDFARDRARFDQLGVRIIWESDRSDIRAVHLHPKDIGAAIVSVDQPTPPESWPWAGNSWREFATQQTTQRGAQAVLSTVIGSADPIAMSGRWAEVLGSDPPADDAHGKRIGIENGELLFRFADRDRLIQFTIAMADPDAALANAREQGFEVEGNVVTICGSGFILV